VVTASTSDPPVTATAGDGVAVRAGAGRARAVAGAVAVRAGAGAAGAVVGVGGVAGVGGEVAVEERFAEGEQPIGTLVGAGPVGDRVEPVRIAGGVLAACPVLAVGGGWAGGGVDGGD
jgi:hypothetical protein